MSKNHQVEMINFLFCQHSFLLNKSSMGNLQAVSILNFWPKTKPKLKINMNAWTTRGLPSGFVSSTEKGDRGGQKNRTEPKPIQTEPKPISNHSVEDFSNLNGLVWFGFKPNRTEKPKCFCNYLKFKN